MKKRILPLLLAVLTATARAQFSVNLPVSVGENAALCLFSCEAETDSLRVSPLSYLDLTQTILSASDAGNLRLYGGNDLYIDHADNLFCMEGVSDLRTDATLTGNLTENGGELTSSNGNLLHKTVALSPALSVETGLGFFLHANETQNQRLSLSFRPAYRQGKPSIDRVLLLEDPVALRAASLPLPDSRRGDIERPYLYYSTYKDENFRPAEESVFENGHLSATALPLVAAVTAFEEPSIYFPAAITPNGDGINDRFEIPTAKNYPDCRLVVLDQHGAVVYDRTPYLNDFDGTGLEAGTYYYLFYKDKNGKPFKRATLTILR
ncbi:MAG: gliding motility-associated C-terminal domain-containing protein [Bacteroides sp.]|nr:gliding motility-associated C-terminal domain-containing protein [Bacteroides sp.]MCM1531447.1 gliding motility-associated C-terminal domain-containing protein [Ruminococcus flavefaciens]MCM1554391.1 gliding motility-associated C-terminal domain-containing protein [Bacteroides sp.]